MNSKRLCILLLPLLTLTAMAHHYREVSYPTPNIFRGKQNTVQGIILHHTALPTIHESLHMLSGHERKVGAHCVIDTDGTRYIMCEPTVVTYHAGASLLHGINGCNLHTIGIEFQGNTMEEPLTRAQIRSAIEYLRPIMKRYNIPLTHIATHQMVREAYRAAHPERHCDVKVDITPLEYARFMVLLILSNALQ